MLHSRTYGLVAGFLALAGMAAVAQTGEPPQVRRMRANGTELAYVEQGHGTPVVFVHGAVTDLRYWEPQRDAFAKQYRFVAYSYRYHGTGSWPDNGGDYTAETHTADLAALITGLKAGPVHLVGLSYGGALAVMLALEHPQLVRTLTLAEPGLFSLLADDAEGKSLLEEWNKGTEPIAAALKNGDTELAVRHLSALVTGGSAEEFDTLPVGLRQSLLENARTLPLLLHAAPPAITCDMLRRIQIPTLFVQGERTPQIFRKTVASAAGCVAGSTTVLVPDASHPMSYDNPAGFNREVLEFIGRHDAAS